MPRFILKKLVRNRIIEHQQAAGARPKYRQLCDAEHKAELVKKLIEEAREVLDAEEKDIASELADVLQVFEDLRRKYGISAEAIAKARAAKNKQYGTFDEGLYVEHVDTLPEDPWTTYFRQHPERFPEI